EAELLRSMRAEPLLRSHIPHHHNRRLIVRDLIKILRMVRLLRSVHLWWEHLAPLLQQRHKIRRPREGASMRQHSQPLRTEWRTNLRSFRGILYLLSAFIEIQMAATTCLAPGDRLRMRNR